MKNSLLSAALLLTTLHSGNSKTIPNYPIANLVIGKPNFVTNTNSPVTSSFNVANPSAVSVDPISQKLFVADTAQNRILRYSSVAALSNGSGAEAVFGQPRFSSVGSSASAEGLNSPFGMFLDRLGRLWVADSNNNRVVMYEAAVFRSSSSQADRVFGQPDFVTTSAGTSATKMRYPIGVWVDSSDRLWVSEYFTNRVLKFDDISNKPNGSAASNVLGQPSFAASASGNGAARFNRPSHISVSSSGSLFVADFGNNRVLRFDNAAALGKGDDASAVIGQPNFTTTTVALNASKLNSPLGAYVGPDDTLWVTEVSNKRVLGFSKASTRVSGSAADRVIGQPGFGTNTLIPISARTVENCISQPFVDGPGNLWVADYGNNRVLRFPPDVTKPLLAVTNSVPKSVTKKKVAIKGTASDTYGISRVQYKIGTGAIKTAAGTTSWNITVPLAVGKNKITIYATDSVGNTSLNKVINVKRIAK